MESSLTLPLFSFQRTNTLSQGQVLMLHGWMTTVNPRFARQNPERTQIRACDGLPSHGAAYLGSRSPPSPFDLAQTRAGQIWPRESETEGTAGSLPSPRCDVQPRPVDPHLLACRFPHSGGASKSRGIRTRSRKILRRLSTASRRRSAKSADSREADRRCQPSLSSKINRRPRSSQLSASSRRRASG